MYRKDLKIGERFGTRVVIEQLKERKNGYVRYKIQCDCGHISEVSSSYLRSKKSSKCLSCSLKEKSKRGSDNHAFKHGYSSRKGGRNKIYSIWVSMRQRCKDPNDLQYADYGGRGIKVCEEWEDFPTFFRDMGDRPDKMTLERIDNDGNYCKANCRWASRKDQCNNKRNNRIHIIKGKEVRHMDLLKYLNMSRDKFRHLEERKGIQWIVDNLESLKS